MEYQKKNLEVMRVKVIKDFFFKRKITKTQLTFRTYTANSRKRKPKSFVTNRVLAEKSGNNACQGN